jgi:trypsin-like peptidase
VVSTGTAFLFEFAKDGILSVPTIVTNKHVIAGAKNGRIIFSKQAREGHRLDNEKIVVDLNDFDKGWLLHPDPDVDLAVLPIPNVLRGLKTQNIEPYIAILGIVNIPTPEEWNQLSPVEEVTIIGYPNGIWDEHNNLPITRRGITATPANKDYLGKKEFLIDAAIFSGSSGSPVFIINEGGYGTEQGFVMGNRYLFLGIVHAVYQYETTGEISIEDIPTISKPVARSRIPNNLGLVIKSTKLLEFEAMMRAELIQRQKHSAP